MRRELRRVAALWLGLCGWLVLGTAFAQAPDQVLFGPKQYLRTTGAPNVYTDSFTVPAVAGAPFALRIANGEASGANRISSGWVKINGVQVVGPADFGQNVAAIERTVTLTPTSTVEVRLASAPGGYFTVSVLGTRILPVPTALTPSPLTVQATATGTLSATLTPAPTASGTLGVSSANPAVATVPDSVSFAAGQSSVPVPVTGVAEGTASITASANGGAASATVNVTPAPPVVTALAPAALTVTQASSGTLTVTISAAQAGDTTVALQSSNSAIASVPASVSVPAGQVGAQVAVLGSSPGDAQITASLNGSTASSQVTVTPLPPTVVSLVPALSSVALGAGTHLVLTISAAQSSDTTVTLVVTPAGIVSAPPEATVPAGQLSVPVPVGSVAYGQAGISATLNGSSASAAINVTASPLAVTALEPAALPISTGATASFTVRINAAQTVNTEIALVSSDAAVLHVPASVTVAQGATSALFSATGLATGDAVITASANDTSKSASVHVAPQPAAIVSLLPSPLPLQQAATGHLTLTLNAVQDADTAVSLANTDPSIATVPASAIVPAGSLSAQIPVNGVSPGTAQVSATVNGTTASASVTVAPQAPTIVSIAPAALSLPKGTPSLLRLTVSRAPNVATAVALSSDAPGTASVPPQLNIPAGALFADVPVASNAVGQATILASLNGTSATSVVTVAPAELVALTLSPQTPTNYAGESVPFTATGTMTDGSSEDFTSRVAWSSSNGAVATIGATGIASVIAAGQTTISAELSFTAVQTGQPVTVAQRTLLTAKIPTPLALTAPNTNLPVGDTVTVTVSTTDAPPFGGLTVFITGTGAGNGTFPPSVTIPEYQTSEIFQFTATEAGPYTLNATAQNRLPAAITFSIGPVIRSVSPQSGEVGSLVTLAGGGFDPLAANNQLTFRAINDGTVAVAALSATTTALTVRVPPLAETGPITLTNSRGTAQSPVFTVVREQDYQLVASPAAVTVPQGASGAAQLQLSSTGTKPFTGLATVSALGLPPGVTASFSPAATLSAFQTAAVTFGASATAAPGTYPITLRADAKEGGQTFSRSSIVNVVVMAAANVTGIKGRFITPDNQGIAGIIVRADIDPSTQPTTTTDAAGNFLLTGLPGGVVTLRMDATPANPLYPIWPYNVTLAASQITVMPDWIVAPPPSADKFKAIVPNSSQEQLITDERYPGLAIRIPAGVNIVGWDGVVKTRMAVERLDPDRLPVSPPPVPTKSVYQLFFGTPMGGIPSAPIPVTLPNDLNLQPGERTELWYYDGSPMGGTGEWKQGGMGTVSADGKVITTDAGSGIPRFCGVCGLPCFVNNQNNEPPPPPPPAEGEEEEEEEEENDNTEQESCKSCPCEPSGSGGGKVTLAIGQELPRVRDLSIAGLVPLQVSRRFHPRDAFNSIAGTNLSLGLGWALTYDVALLPISSALTRVILAGNDQVNFNPDGAGAFQTLADPRFAGATLRSVTGNAWELKLKNGSTWRFEQFGLVHLLIEKKDSNGNSLVISRASNGRIQSVLGGQRSLSFSYGANGFISEIRDGISRTVGFTYSQGRLETVTGPDGGVTRYTYVDDNEFPQMAACASTSGGVRLKTIQRPGQTEFQTLFYGPGRRVLRETLANGEENRFSYTVVGACITHVSNPTVRCTANCPTVDSWENFQAGWRIWGGTITETALVDGRGQSRSQRFDGRKRGTSIINALGLTKRYVRDPSTSRVTQIFDSLNRSSSYSYDPKGNLTRFVDALGREMDATYDATWNKLTSITRRLADGTLISEQYAYNPANGNLVSRTDPLNNVTTFAYTPRGELQTVTVPGNRTTTFGYNAAGDLVSVTDPLGNVTSFNRDEVGRSIATTDALGFSTRRTYNAVDQVTQLLDANLGLTQLNYDARRNLISVVNPLNAAIETYAYDPLRRLKERTDAKLKNSLLQHDTAGNLTTFVNRKGETTTFVYDQQNRIARIDYPGGVTQTRSYDAIGRLIEIREPDNAILYTYDDADRLIKEVTESVAGRHEIGYEYDALDRITRRTVDGGDPTTYTYDSGSRPLTISFRNRSTTYAWDDAGRLTGKTLPNGVVQEFAYDDADRLSMLTYRKADSTVIEALSYGYDATGQRITEASSIPSANETPFTATYDEANRLTSLTLTGSGQTFALAYDNNGNLASKTDEANPGGTTNYTWDSRNRLVGINGPAISASFTYDAVGRRTSKTVNGQTIGYVYDGLQAIGEVTGGTLSTAVLTTLAVDDVVARYSQNGNRTYLTNALGSVFALAKDDQAIQSYYAYSPYGESVTLGVDEGNPIQYTGRENDATGLYFYRARYYDPVLKRFIAEDPIGLSGGLNAYAYVDNNPVMYSDPEGLQARPPIVVRRTPNPNIPQESQFPEVANSQELNRVCVQTSCPNGSSGMSCTAANPTGTSSTPGPFMVAPGTSLEKQGCICLKYDWAPGGFSTPWPGLYQNTNNAPKWLKKLGGMKFR